MHANSCCGERICTFPWPAEPGMLRPRPPAWLAAFAARIENGRLTAGRSRSPGSTATLTTLETGALSATGTAQFSGQAWHFTARLTGAGPMARPD